MITGDGEKKLRNSIIFRVMSALVALIFCFSLGLASQPVNAGPPPGSAAAVTSAAPVVGTSVGTVKVYQWANAKEVWTTGDLNGRNSNYSEGDTVPFKLEMTNADTGVTSTIAVVYDFSRDGIGEYAALVNYKTTEDPVLPTGVSWQDQNAIFTYANASLTKTGPTAPSGAGQVTRSYTLSLTPSASTAYVLWGGQLAKAGDLIPDGGGATWAKGASSIQGAPAHMNTNPGGDLPISSSAISATPSLKIIKSGPDYAHVGDVITYTYVISNNTHTQVNQEDIQIVDDIIGTILGTVTHTGNGNLTKLGYKKTWTYTVTYTVLESDNDPLTLIDNDPLINNVDLKVNGTTVSESDWSVDILHPAMTVTKEADRTQVNRNDTINYTVKISNASNDTPLTITALADALKDSLGGTVYVHTTPTYVSGDTGPGGIPNGILDVGETWTYTYSANTGSAPEGNFENTIKVTAVDALGGTKGTLNKQGTATVLVLVPQMTVIKSATETQVNRNDTIHYTVTVKNDSKNTPITITKIKDALGDPEYVSGDTNGNDILDVNETWVFKYSTNTTGTTPEGDFVNTVTVTAVDDVETGDNEVEKTASATVLVLVPQMTVTKTADQSVVNQNDVITYTVTVRNDSDYTPLTIDPINGIIDNRGTPVYTGGDTNNDGVLDVGETWTYTYTVTAPSSDGEFVNIVTVNAVDGVKTGDGKVVKTDNAVVLVTSTPIEPPAGGAPTLIPNNQPVITISLLGGPIQSYPVTTAGALIADAVYTSPDGLQTITIPAGTLVLNANGTPTYRNRDPDIVSVVAEGPQPPAGYTTLGAYTLSPTGVTFDQPITLAFNYDPSLVPANGQTVVAFYDAGAGKWVDLETAGFIAADGTAVQNSAACQVMHFTYFAVFVK